MLKSKLRGVVPQTIKERTRLKAFIYGGSGTGKSYFSTQFPSVYYVDCEKGVQNSKYLNNISKNNGVVFQTTSFEELLNEVKLLATEEHGFQTLVIDPITTIYSDLVDKEAELVKQLVLKRASGKTKIGEEYQAANKKFKKFVNLLLDIDMNIIVTAHVKDKWEGEKAAGTTYDAYKKFDFMFDVILETLVDGNNYMAISRKSRLANLSANHRFPFSYETFHKLYEKELAAFHPKPITLADDADDSLSVSKTAATITNISDAPKQSSLVSGELLKKISFYFENGGEDISKRIDSYLKNLNLTLISELNNMQADKVISGIEKSNPELLERWESQNIYG